MDRNQSPQLSRENLLQLSQVQLVGMVIEQADKIEKLEKAIAVLN
jgi:hypothetical protein